MFIVIEGVDGSGKTTAGEELAKRLGGYFYRTPSGFWRKNRSIVEERCALIRFLYYLLATICSSLEIRSSIKKDLPIICDRYIYSTWAHHVAYGLNILKYIPIRLAPVIKPDVAVYLYIDDQTRMDRLALRSGNTKKDLDTDSLKVAHNVFMEFDELVKINTAGLSKSETVEELLKII